VVITGYISIGTQLEEHDLIQQFGDSIAATASTRPCSSRFRAGSSLVPRQSDADHPFSRDGVSRIEKDGKKSPLLDLYQPAVRSTLVELPALLTLICLNTRLTLDVGG
jgi:hypothetical protein